MGSRVATGGVPRHAGSTRARARARGVALVLVAVVAFGTSFAGFTLLRWRSNMTTLPSFADLVAPPPAGATAPGQEREVDVDDPMSGRAVTLLVLGTDDRSGANAALAGAKAGGGSDTTLVVHLSADRSRVEIVSIPRDSRAEIPACHLDLNPDGPMSRPRTAKFNEAFAVGWATGEPALAAACTSSTVQTMTGLTVDGVVIVDMAGFVGMVEAVGGVRVCVPEPVRDTRYTHLDLPAGWADLDGVTALRYVRARHVDGGDGTDPARIDRQHQFLGALVRKVLSSDVLTSPLATGRFIDAMTSSLTISAELGDPAELLGLGWSLRGLGPEDLTFMTVPWAYAEGGRYVAWTDDAAEVWARLLADEPLGASGTSGASGTGDAGGSPPPTAGAAAAGPGAAEGVPPSADGAASAPVAGAVLRTAEESESAVCG